MAYQWLIITLLVTISVGLVAFINKIFANKRYDQRYSAISLYGLMFLFSLIYLMIAGYKDIGIQNILMAALWGLQIYSYSILMMTILRYLPTSTYFISVRLSSSFILLLVGIVFFKDIITKSEAIGFVLGVLAMIFLFDKEKKEDADYKKGIFYLLIAIGSLVIGHVIAKTFSLDLQASPTVLVMTFFFAFIFSLIIGFNTIKKNKKHFVPILKLNLIQATLYIAYFIMLFYVYNAGDLGISYKIMSYSPFIPIILATIFYKEKITLKKGIALALSILSLWFFV